MTRRGAWYGVVLWREEADGSLAVCSEYQAPRRSTNPYGSARNRDAWELQLELPKGGTELVTPRESSGLLDSNPWQTARWELWEEAGVWLQWRDGSSGSGWYLKDGSSVPAPRFGLDKAWLLTRLRDDDVVVPCESRRWLSLAAGEEGLLRRDHCNLVRRLLPCPRGGV